MMGKRSLLVSSPFTSTDRTSLETIVDCSFTVVNVVKHRSLDSEFLDSAYPTHMPFFIYGSAKELHVDHIIVRRPNVQLTASNVRLELADNQDLSHLELQLQEGLLAIAETIPEKLMQPFSAANPPSFFKPNMPLRVSLWQDPRRSIDSRTEFEDLGVPIASGALVLSENLFVDYTMLNIDSLGSSDDSRKPWTPTSSASTVVQSQEHPLLDVRWREEMRQEHHVRAPRNSTNEWRERWDAALAERRF